jgi:hypothetical protein
MVVDLPAIGIAMQANAFTYVTIIGIAILDLGGFLLYKRMTEKLFRKKEEKDAV